VDATIFFHVVSDIKLNIKKLVRFILFRSLPFARCNGQIKNKKIEGVKHLRKTTWWCLENDEWFQ